MKNLSALKPVLLITLLLISLPVRSQEIQPPQPPDIDWTLGDGKDVINEAVPLIPFQNTHIIDIKKRVIRGPAPIPPAGSAKPLIDAGITDVIIFKKDTGHGEIDLEKTDLGQAAGQDHPVTIQYIPFKWKILDPYKTMCEETIDALSTLMAVETAPSERKVYFHCTMGEDRTGYLAGLFQLLYSPTKIIEIFQYQMCKNGYEAGAGTNGKPMDTINIPIRKELTPLFMKMAYLIATGKISLGNISKSVCETDPADDVGYQNTMIPKLSLFICADPDAKP